MSKLLKLILLVIMNCCVTWIAFGQGTDNDSILITDQEYRDFRTDQERLAECRTVEVIKDMQIESYGKIISEKDDQIKLQQRKTTQTESLNNLVRQELILSRNETSTAKKLIRKWQFYTFSVGITGIILSTYLLTRH